MLTVAASLAACDLVFPDAWDDRLIFLAALNTDSAEHLVLAAPVADAAETPSITVELYRGTPNGGSLSWTLVASAKEDKEPCAGQPYYTSLGVARCLSPGAMLDPGAAYMVEVSAEGYRTARGRTLAVGDFEINSAVLTRSGTSATLDASWTGSVAAHRYFVALRRLHPPYGENPKGWYAEVDGTSATVSLPGSAIDEAVEPVTLDVTALSKEVHDYLTSGTEGEFFSVPPIQNVENGFGFVGSMRVRSLVVEFR